MKPNRYLADFVITIELELGIVIVVQVPHTKIFDTVYVVVWRFLNMERFTVVQADFISRIWIGPGR